MVKACAELCVKDPTGCQVASFTGTRNQRRLRGRMVARMVASMATGAAARSRLLFSEQ